MGLSVREQKYTGVSSRIQTCNHMYAQSGQHTHMYIQTCTRKLHMQSLNFLGKELLYCVVKSLPPIILYMYIRLGTSY